MAKRIAIGGSAANPSHLGHQDLIRAILESGRFDRVMWVISGTRSDKPDLVGSGLRVAMALATFPKEWFAAPCPSFSLDIGDAFGRNMPTIEYLECWNRHPEVEVFWFTGVDVCVPQDCFGGRCEVAARWVRGNELMENWRFVVVPRDGYPHPRTLELPPQFEVLEGVEPIRGSSTEIRNLVCTGQNFEHLVTPAVAACIRRHGLYGWKEAK